MKLSTPCNGFIEEILQDGFGSVRIVFQLHVMDSHSILPNGLQGFREYFQLHVMDSMVSVVGASSISWRAFNSM